MPMCKQKYLLFLFVAVIFVCDFVPVTNALLKGATFIDDTRARYIELEKESWNIVENGVDQNAILKQIFTNHNLFIDNFLTNSLQENQFLVLESLYEWKTLEATALWPTDRLFDQFKSLLNKSDEFFDKLANEDFADTVLNDRTSVKESLEQIENIMIKQSVYYKAGSVGTIYSIIMIWNALFAYSLDFC